MNIFNSIKYNRLVKLYRHKIYTYSYYMTRNRMDADDITQETLIRLWENIEYFKEESTNAWIMRTSNNLCLDFLRRRQKSVAREFSPSFEDRQEDSYMDIESPIDSPERTAHLHLAGQKVKEAVENLPAKLKSVFVLREIQGFKHREIAAILKLPEGTVKVDLMRARKILQGELKDYDN